MKRARFTESRIIKFLKAGAAGRSAQEPVVERNHKWEILPILIPISRRICKINHGLILIHFIFLYFSLLSSNAQITTQNGFIILNNNDTIFGKLENSYTGHWNKCVFIRENSSQIDFFNPDQIKHFFIFPNISFQTEEVNGRKKFFQVLSKGKMNLYKNGSNLYISCSPDSLIQLRGGRETYKQGSRTFARIVYTYKHQIKTCVPDTFLYKRIDELYFSQKPILQFAQQVNYQDQIANEAIRAGKLYNANHIGLQIGMSENTFNLNNRYESDSTFLIYTDQRATEKNSHSVNHHVNSLAVGISYKRKISTSNSYLLLGANYDRMFKTKMGRTGFLHAAMAIPGTGDPVVNPVDTIGKVVDAYTYQINSINLPISFYNEISFSRFHPFYAIGISGKYNLNKGISLNRKIYIDEKLIEENNVKLQIPAFLLGIDAGIGCRYLINMNRSISVNANVEWFEMDKKSNTPNYNRIFIKRIFLTYNF